MSTKIEIATQIEVISPCLKDFKHYLAADNPELYEKLKDIDLDELARIVVESV